MPYEYRKMTPAQQEEIVQNRRERGYPLHSPPHPFRQAAHYLISAANWEHHHIMASPDRRTAFEDQLIAAMENIKAEICGWVILANHYHLLVGVDTLDQISIALKQLHGTTSRTWNAADGQTGQRRVWYRFVDRMIRSEAQYYQALNYIHFNPVKHQYVNDAYAWPWSSLHMYVSAEDYGREWLRERWRRYPPGDLGKGWDN